MNEKEYLVNNLKETIGECLEKTGYYPASRDGEYNEKKFYEEVDLLTDAIIEDKPNFIFEYVNEYYVKNLNIN